MEESPKSGKKITLSAMESCKTSRIQWPSIDGVRCVEVEQYGSLRSATAKLDGDSSELRLPELAP